MSMLWISESKLRNNYGRKLGVSSHTPWKFVHEALTVVVVVVVVVVVAVVVVVVKRRRRRRRRNIIKVAKLMEYEDGKEDPLIQIVGTHQHSTCRQCCRQLEALRITERNKTNKENHI
jgi:flagellar biosynthesis/type III secretory pathway M-ring protein FliF/YscJ